MKTPPRYALVIGSLLLIFGLGVVLRLRPNDGQKGMSQRSSNALVVTATSNHVAGLSLDGSPLTLDIRAPEGERGTPESPTNATAISGTFYRGDGLGYNISLTLETNGNYAAEWYGCRGKYGEASGKWRLAGQRIVFTPSEKEMMKEQLTSLDVLRFKGDWILVPTDKRGQEFYDKWGVSNDSCFQRNARIK